MSAVTLTNLGGYGWGIANDETGINIQKLTIKAHNDKFEVANRIGEIVGRADFKWKQSYSIEGVVTGTTGLPANKLADIVTLANVAALGGIASTGAVLMDEMSLDYVPNQPGKLNVSLTRYNGIPSTATQTTL